MRVVFLENVPRVANAGDVKEVADGYGRNYLIPQRLAKAATAAVLKEIAAQHQSLDQRAAKVEAEAEGLAKQLEGASVTITAKVGAQGRLYGSVTNQQVAAELQKLTGKAIDRRRVLLHNPIRSLGAYPVEVHLASNLSATVTVNVTGIEA
jgi:large subunit ribosomal protein L9